MSNALSNKYILRDLLYKFRFILKSKPPELEPGKIKNHSGGHQYITKALLFMFLINQSVQADLFYLEDADSTPAAKMEPSTINVDHNWPRIILSETQSMRGDLEKYSKYQIIATQAGAINKIVKLQNKYPDLVYFRMLNPHENLNYANEDDGIYCGQSHGIPFETSLSYTGNCSVYPGHWAYKPGTKLTRDIDASTSIVEVDDVSHFTLNEYVVIYGAPAGSFNDMGEHAKVVGIDPLASTLSLIRAYKSTPRKRYAGDIIAQHIKGYSSKPEPRNWVYNLSSISPKDQNGNRYLDYLSTWLKNNYTKNRLGENTAIKVSGILFDTDGYISYPHKKLDANNDLTEDFGFSNDAVNLWSKGLKSFYHDVRINFPNHLIIGGVRDSIGFDDLNGVQMEGFPSYSNFTSAKADYSKLGGLLALYTYQARHNAYAPANTHVLSKTPNKLYPHINDPDLPGLEAFRFAFGMSLLEDGYFGFINSVNYPDVWYDEYAVDSNPGSTTYAHAIVSTPLNESAIRSHLGWLGRPVGLRKRIYKDADFDLSKNLLWGGDFNSGISGWSNTSNVTIKHDTQIDNRQDGLGTLHGVNNASQYTKMYQAQIRSPDINIVKNQQYTLVFSAKSNEVRTMSVNVGSHTERVITGPHWQRFVLSFSNKIDYKGFMKFNIGNSSAQTWLDSVYLFKGNPNIFKREFDNGLVVVNATNTTQTIDLGNQYQRIKGQQSAVNDGMIYSKITLPAYDAALLIKPDRIKSHQSPPLSWLYLLLLD